MAGRRQSRVKYRPYEYHYRRDSVPPGLRRLLHVPLDHQPDTRYAEW